MANVASPPQTAKSRVIVGFPLKHLGMENLKIHTSNDCNGFPAPPLTPAKVKLGAWLTLPETDILRFGMSSRLFIIGLLRNVDMANSKIDWLVPSG